MSLESFMLKDEVKEIEYVASDRFKNKEGQVEKWKLKTITADENDAIRLCSILISEIMIVICEKSRKKNETRI